MKLHHWGYHIMEAIAYPSWLPQTMYDRDQSHFVPAYTIQVFVLYKFASLYKHNQGI